MYNSDKLCIFLYLNIYIQLKIMKTSDDIIQTLIDYSRALAEFDAAILYQQNKAIGYGYMLPFYFN